MFQKKYLFILIGALIMVMVLAVVYLLFFNKNKSNNDKSSTEQITQQLKESSKLYFELYNTYQFGDYTNMSYLGASYALDDMQNQISNRYETLKENTPEGYKLTSTANLNDIKVAENNGSSAKVIILGRAVELNSSSTISKKININTTLVLYKVGSNWMLYSLEQDK